MAQEANGLPYEAPSNGSGAVYFDKTVDPLQLQIEQLKMGDVAQQRRKAEQDKHLELTQKLVGDINPDTKGIFDVDGTYFQDKTKGLYDKYADVLGAGYHPENPAFRDIYGKMQYEKKALENDVQVSKAQKDMFVNYVNDLNAHPEKYDVAASNKNIARFRAEPFETRKTMDLSKMLIPKETTPSTLDWLSKNAKELLPKDAIGETIDFPDGTKGIKTTTTWTDKTIQNHAATIAANPERSDVAVKEINMLPDASKTEIARQAQARGVPPQQIYFEQTLRGLNTKQEKYQEGKFSPYVEQQAKLWGEGKKEDESAKLFVEQWDAVKRGDAHVWSPGQTQFLNEDGTVKVGDRGVWYSDNFKNMPAGQYSEPLKDDQGNVVGYDKPQPSLIMGMKYEDGKLKMATTETMGKSYSSPNNPPDHEGYVNVNDGMIISIAKANGVKPEAVRNALIDLSKYGNGNKVPTFVGAGDIQKIRTQGTAAQKPASGKITVTVNGKVGEIPAESWEAFKKKYPTATKQ
jgi:hypothetical protein